MPYPNDPPINFKEFDHRKKEQLASMYRWAGSCGKLSRSCFAAGYPHAVGTLNEWRERFGIPIADEAYRQRSLAARGTLAEEAVDIEQESESDELAEAIRGLTEYLQYRTLPLPKMPVLKEGRKYATEVIGCDLHFPHHHKKAFEVFLAVLDKLKPQGVTLDGDTLDMAYISHYRKNPALNMDMQSDLNEVRAEVFGRVKGVVDDDCDMKVVFGNHETSRWRNYLWDKVPAIARLNVLDFESLLGLAEMGWRYLPTGYWLTPALYVFHGERHTNAIGGGSAMSAKKEMLDIGSSGVSGHGHRMGLFYRKDSMQFRVWAEGGCLCDEATMRRLGLTNQKQHVDKVYDWHLGFTVVEYNPKGDSFVVMPYPIIEEGSKVFTIIHGEEIRV